MSSLRFNYGHIALPERPTASLGKYESPGTVDSDRASTAATEAVLGKISVFARAEPQAEDPILGMRDMFLADPATNKLNLAVGVYRTEEGKPLVLKCVQEAEATMLEEQKKGKTFKEYLPQDGMSSFCSASLKLLYGDAIAPALEEGRVAVAQSISGTGGLYLAARMIEQLMPGATVHVPSPTWPIHPDIFTSVGLRVAYYPYYDADTCGLDFEGCLLYTSPSPRDS